MAMNKGCFHKFYKQDNVTGYYACQVNMCDAQYSCYHSTNFKKHLKIHHSNVYSSKLNEKCQLSMKNCAIANGMNTDSVSNSKKTNKLKLRNGKVMKKKDVIQFTIRDKVLLNNCMEMIIKNGRSIDIINDSGFRKIIDPIIKNININNLNKQQFNIDESVIELEIIKKANLIKDNIKSLIRNQILNLNIDIMTRNDKSILVIHVQLQYLGESKLKTLALIEFTKENKPCFLKKKMNEVFEAYAIKLEQILTVNIKNSTNFVLMEFAETYCSDLAYLWYNDMDNLVKIEFIMENLQIKTENVYYDSIDDNDNIPNIPMIVDVSSAPLTFKPKSLITTITCSPFTLQLCIENALKDITVQSTILKTKEILRNLRLPNMLEILKSFDCEKSDIRDVETELCRTYDILHNIINLKQTINLLSISHPELTLNALDWSLIENIVKCITPINNAIVFLKTQNLTIGDFYATWIKCFTETKKVNSPLSEKLCSHMEKQQDIFLSNNVILSALYLDPRFQSMLNDTKKTFAKKFLARTWDIIVWLENNSEENIPMDGNPNIPKLNWNAPSTFTSQDEDIEIIDDEIEQFIKLETSIELNKSQVMSPTNKIRAKLELFDNHPRLHHSANIKEFWEERRTKEPEQYKLAQVFMSIPVNEASVDRSLSGLNYIMSNSRNSLTTNLLDNIMIIRENE